MNYSKKILISGASGFIGENLVNSLKSLGKYEIYTLVRRMPIGGFEIQWDPERSSIDRQSLETIQPDIVIHLSGENVMGFWTSQKKKKIVESRIKSTKLLADTLSSLSHKPELFISASGCTYYGSDIYHPVDEFSPKGNGFLSDLVERWERASDSLRYQPSPTPLYATQGFSTDSLSQLLDPNINSSSNSITLSDSNSSLNSSTSEAFQKSKTRVVYLRIGLVFDKAGPFLSTVYYPFKFGLGGVMGSGQQWIPWVSLRDTLRMIHYIIDHEDLEGPINITGPNAVTNSNFTRTLGYVLKRPTIFWVPEFLIKLVMGKEFANETILSSQRVIPTKLINHGYKFLDIDLYETLKFQYLDQQQNQITL